MKEKSLEKLSEQEAKKEAIAIVMDMAARVRSMSDTIGNMNYKIDQFLREYDARAKGVRREYSSGSS